MSEVSNSNSDDRSRLVAYLDGELQTDDSRSVRALLAVDPASRDEADRLQRVWSLLDHLPTVRTSKRLADETLEIALHASDLDDLTGWRMLWPWLAFVASFAAVAFVGFRTIPQPAPSQPEITENLSLARNLDLYQSVGTWEFLNALDQSLVAYPQDEP